MGAAMKTSAYPIPPRSVLAASLVASLLGCSSSGAAPPLAGDPPPAPEAACPAPSTTPTPHAGDVLENQVWTAAASPHVVTGDVNVRSSARLLIEPCAEVRFAPGAHLFVAYPGTPSAGALVAEGTAARPIRFVGDGGARWASVSVHAPGTARLAHVFLSGGGGGDFEESSTIAVWGDGDDGADPLLFVDHVTVEGSLGTGVWLHRGASFAAGSRDLVVTRSGSDAAPWPVQVDEHGVGTLPTGRYRENRVDAILLTPAGGSAAGAGMLEDATLRDLGVPYLVGREPEQRLKIGGRVDGRAVTLTIEAGVELRFAEGSGIDVQTHTSDQPSTAALRVLGTRERPVVMTSAAANPRPGDWRGIWYGGVPRAENRIEHARIEYAGGPCSCILNTCSEITRHDGAIVFTAEPPSAFVHDTTFRAIAGHGVTQGFDGRFVDFKATNTFDSVSGCAQTRPRNVDTSCPTPKPACE